jgi:uncharacterized protein with HEPN domain
MKAGAPRLADNLEHIASAVDRIGRYTESLDEAGFPASDLVQDAVVRNLQVIGEACRNIEREQPEFAAAHPALPLGRAYAMRNALTHGYFKISAQVVWQTPRDDLPPLLHQVRQLLSERAAADAMKDTG